MTAPAEGNRRSRRVRILALALGSWLTGLCWLYGETPEVPPAGGTSVAVELVFADGKKLAGILNQLSSTSISLKNTPQPIALLEVHEIRLPVKSSGKTIDFSSGPVISFRSGEKILGRLVEIKNSATGPLASFSLGVEGIPPVSGQLAALAAFRLREAYKADPVFEQALEAEPPPQDVFVLRRSGLLSVTGVFRGIDKDYLQVEIAGKRSRVRRQLVQGVVLTPIASDQKDADPPARLEIPGLGQLPVYLKGMEQTSEGPVLLFRLPLSPAVAIQKIPLSFIGKILPASDKIVFLSNIEPARVEETAVLGKAFAYRKDLSVSGDPLQLKGQTYRKGLGVHSRTVLDYSLNNQYSNFAATVGIDDSSRGKGSVTFVVSVDGKERLRENFDSARKPLPISISVAGAKTLRLLVDYGKDQLDFADHADWANARLTR